MEPRTGMTLVVEAIALMVIVLLLRRAWLRSRARTNLHESLKTAALYLAPPGEGGPDA